jgi:hypothetical protein
LVFAVAVAKYEIQPTVVLKAKWSVKPFATLVK